MKSYLSLFSLLGPLAMTAHAVTIDWATVGNAGNAADGTGYGAVSDTYYIARNETTISQYAEFFSEKNRMLAESGKQGSLWT